jgi:histidinol dehydrogenase
VLRRIDLRGVPLGEIPGRLPRPEVGGEGPVGVVREILADVRERGDEALLDYTRRFDRVQEPRLVVDREERRAALAGIDPALRAALVTAADRIRRFHEHQLVGDHRVEGDGIVIDALHRAVDRAGCYVPCGRAVYPSTVLMTAVPARVAGVPEVVLVVPPAADGAIPAVTLAAAEVAGVDEVYAVGGAQAVAALAYGTATIGAVDVVVGPGNVYVAIAKREVAGVVGVPSAFAGPSEVVVVADSSAPARFAAVDVVVQAEHGPHGLAWLVTWEEAVADAVVAEIEAVVAAAPRADDIRTTLAEAGIVALVDSPEAAMAVANGIAPEHLQLMTTDPEALVPLVRHAGAVFCGPWSPASVGDYLAGPSHVLPTAGTARFGSALTVADFRKELHVVRVSREGFASVAPHVIALAEAEGLDAHAESVRIRLEQR